MKIFCTFFFIITTIGCSNSVVTSSSCFSVQSTEKLTAELLNNAEQIYPTKGKGVFLLLDCSTELFDSDYYLYYFNSEEKLTDICYLSSFGIDTIVDNSLIAWKGFVYDDRKQYKPNSLPNKYQLKLKDVEGGGYGALRNKLIEELSVNYRQSLNNLEVEIIYYKGIKRYYSSIRELKYDSLAILDTVYIPIGEVYFNTESIYTISQNLSTDNLEEDRYVFSTTSQKNHIDSVIVSYFLK
jgi:hypothetical protein